MNSVFQARVPSLIEVEGTQVSLLRSLGFEFDEEGGESQANESGTFEFSRDTLFEALWSTFGGDSEGLVGIHEGTVLSDEANERGLTTESWTLDSGEAPRERDWIGDSDSVETQFFFASEESASAVHSLLVKLLGAGALGPVTEQENRDWDAEWKASFRGIRVEPDWLVLPPWGNAEELSPGFQGRTLTVLPGAGFGTGTHETTQLCLKLLSQVHREKGARSSAFAQMPVLDFGSGSGILGLAAAHLGHSVDAIEIDPLAIDNAIENAALNQLESKVRYAQRLEDLEPNSGSKYSLIFANILRPVLIEFAPLLLRSWRVHRDGERGAIILSGLIENDVSEVISRYNSVFEAMQPDSVLPKRVLRWTQVAQGDWRGLLAQPE